MSSEPAWTDVVGALGAVAIGVVALFIAGTQTWIAWRQNKISASLTALEERRDEPYLVVESFRVEPADGDDRFYYYDVIVTIRNVGGGTAWDIRVHRIRMWIQPGAGARGPLHDGKGERDINLDVAEDPQRPRRVQTLAPGDSSDLVVSMASRIHFTYAPVVDVQVILGRMSTVAADAMVWNTGHRPETAWSGDDPPDGYRIGRMVPTNDRERFEELGQGPRSATDAG